MTSNKSLSRQLTCPGFCRGSRAQCIAMTFGLAIITTMCYSNSFHAPFHFDDHIRIEHNPAIRTLWPLSTSMDGTSRPIGMLTLAFNYSLHGLSVFGYHATNLFIHILASLTLFALIRRTVLYSKRTLTFAENASVFAFVVALIWAVHPLNTQAVTYIIQRLESLMALFYLSTLYFFSRAYLNGNKTVLFSILSVLACALGMGTKEVMVTAPIMVLWYDRVFAANSWAEIVRHRWCYYSFLASTWGVLAFCMLRCRVEFEAGNIGTVEGVTPLDYFLTQAGVISHYLRLTFWPVGQCIDYGWPVTMNARDILLPLGFVGTLFVATCWAIRRLPVYGFLGGWFFLILAPTSSIVPIVDLAFEHRMYLPLISVIILIASVISYSLDAARVRQVIGFRGARNLRRLFSVVAICLLGIATWNRNEVYCRHQTLWEDALKTAPMNWRIHTHLGAIFQKAEDFKRSEKHNRIAVKLAPTSADAHLNLGALLMALNELPEAVVHFNTALELRPDSFIAHANLGISLWKLGQRSEAEKQFAEALSLAPDSVEVLSNIAKAYLQGGEFERAMKIYETALSYSPDDGELLYNIGVAHQENQDFDSAMKYYLRSIEADPDFPPPYNNVGFLLVAQGRFSEAVNCFRRVAKLQPQLAVAHANLGNALIDSGQTSEGIAELKRALEIEPDSSSVRARLDGLLAPQHGR